MCAPPPLPPQNILSSRSHANWPINSLSARYYEGILDIENLGREVKHPVQQKPKLSKLGTYNILLIIFYPKNGLTTP